MSLSVKTLNAGILLDLGHKVAHESEGPIDRPWCERVAQRLRGEFGNLIAAFPPHAQRATAMARLLGLQVPLCHRILSGTLASGGAAPVLGTFPGTTGLSMFVHAAKRIQSVPPAPIERAEAAIKEFAELIAHSGGSQRRLLDALNQAQPTDGKHPGPAGLRLDNARRLAFEAAVTQIGCSTEQLIGLRVYTPAATPTCPVDLDVTALVGRVGFKRTSEAMPFVLYHAASAGKPSDGPAGPHTFLIEDFCTQPLPNVLIEQRNDKRIGIVDANFEHTEAVDIFAGPFFHNSVVTVSNGRAYLNCGTLLSTPTRNLLTDVYVPRAWAAELNCTAAIYRDGPLGGLNGPPAQRWFDRLPIPLLPSLLGPGLANAHSDLHARHEELTAKAFQFARADPADYVGFRLAVAHPILQTHYLCFERSIEPQAQTRDQTKA